MLISELVRQILFLSHQWGPAVYVGSYDIKTAFDTMRHHFMFNALLTRGAPESLAVSLVWELCDVKADAFVIGVAEAHGIDFNSGGRQGGTETTWCWKITIEYMLEELVNT